MTTDIDKAIGREIRHLLNETANVHFVETLRCHFGMRANELDPPRIPEPGWWGVVMVNDHEWGRVPRKDEHRGWLDDNGVRVRWCDLPDPITLVRAGEGDS